MGNSLSRLLPKTRYDRITNDEMQHRTLARRPSTPPHHAPGHSTHPQHGRHVAGFVDSFVPSVHAGQHIHFREPVFRAPTPPRR